MKAAKIFLRRAINFTIDLAIKTPIGRYLFEQVLTAGLNRVIGISHRGLSLLFTVPNSTNHFRVKTFSSKEPETLEWIDSLENGSVLWDIGANVGLYSCYAAKAQGCKVFAFEPSVFNIELLARNIFLNSLTEQVVIVPLPLSDRLATNTLNMSMTEWGGAMSTFGESYTHDGRPLAKVFEFQTLGLSIDDAVTRLGIPKPDHIKMDVDGIEHLILSGGLDTLATVKSILIEINEEFQQQSRDSSFYLNRAGLELVEKRHSEMFGGTLVFNQIWRRPAAK